MRRASARADVEDDKIAYTIRDNIYKKMHRRTGDGGRGPERARELADETIKNTYRTLMTRGMKGCYVYATDPGLRAYLKQRSEQAYQYQVVEI